MARLDTARRRLDAWNAHDATTIVLAFAADGTDRDPGYATIAGR